MRSLNINVSTPITLPHLLTLTLTVSVNVTQFLIRIFHKKNFEMKFRNNYSCLKLFHSISVIFISVVVQLGNSQSVISSKEESNLWNLENLLGEEEYGTYFRGYDILLGGTLMEGGGELYCSILHMSFQEIMQNNIKVWK